MRDMGTRFRDVMAAIDAANAEDPNLVRLDRKMLPAELDYGHRMCETLNRMDPDASECLQIAARGQHVGRWRVPHKNYSPGRSGYLQWRRYQRDCQAKLLGDLMTQSGYSTDEIERVGSLIKKKALKTDADAQMLEDVICVAFFEHYLLGFINRVDEEKLAGILAKTWKRMSEQGHKYASQLQLPQGISELLARGLNARPTPDAASKASNL